MLSTDGNSILKGLTAGQEMTLSGEVVRKKKVIQTTPQLIKIEMTKTTPGSLDGIHVQDFQAGKVYALPKSLAESLLLMRVGKEYKEPEQEMFAKDEIKAEAKTKPEPAPAPEKLKPAQNKAVSPSANKRKANK